MKPSTADSTQRGPASRRRRKGRTGLHAAVFALLLCAQGLAFAADPDHREFRSDDGSHYQVLDISLPGTGESAWLAADFR